MKKNYKIYVYGIIIFLIIVFAALSLAMPVTAQGLDGGGAYLRRELSGAGSGRTAGA